MNGDEAVREIAQAVGGTITEMGALPDGSGFAMMSIPLRKDHWIYGAKPEECNKVGDDYYEPPPMPFRMGTKDAPRLNRTRQMWEEALRAAGRYAVRSATMKGAEMDFDPDALLQNLIVGFLGYHTDDGFSNLDDWANPRTDK